MNTLKKVLISGLALASLLMLPVARGTEENQATKLTFNQPVEIPGHVLPAGTYWFVVAGSIDRDLVQVFKADRTTLCATILTIDAERLRPTKHTALTFAQREATPSNAIVTWFYPGSNSGHEFVYPRSEARQLDRAKQETVVASAPGSFKTLVSGD